MEHHVHLDTPAEPSTDGPVITLTDKALDMVRETIRREHIDGHILRIGVLGGGCSGYKYDLGFEASPKPDDTVVDFSGVKVAISQDSLKQLRGVTLDYVSSLSGGGFKFINPNASRTCGCGSSFS